MTQSGHWGRKVLAFKPFIRCGLTGANEATRGHKAYRGHGGILAAGGAGAADDGAAGSRWINHTHTFNAGDVECVP